MVREGGQELFAPRARAGLVKRVTAGADLKALVDRGEAEFGRDGAAVPRHERGANFENFSAIPAHDLGDLGAIALAVGVVELLTRADIDFAELGAGGEDGQGAVDGGAGDGVVNFSRVLEKFFCGEVVALREGGVEDGQPLGGGAQASF